MTNMLEWQEIQSQLHAAQEGNNKRIETILVIEDNVEFSESLAIRLRKENYNVVTAEDGVEGLALIESMTPDLVVLDLGLPRMSGMKVLENMRELYGNLPVPVIVLTGNADSRLKVRIKNFGVTKLLCKPIRQKIVAETIHETLSGE